MNKKLKLSCLSLAMASVLIPGTTAYANEEEAKDTKDIEVITVTSRKRVETLVEVPMNVTSVSAMEIADRNLITKDDLQRTLAGAASPTGVLILRGLSGGNSAAPSTTSSFTDDIPFNFVDLYDTEAVEVLRGPQGTLWGSNAIGGTIRVITQKPRLDTFEFISSAQTKSTKNVGGNELQAWAAINIPLIDDTLAMRITGHNSHKPGAIVNANTGVQRKVEDRYLRTQVLWQINDDTNVNFGYYNVSSNSIGTRIADLSQPTGRRIASTTPNPDSLWGYDVAYTVQPCPAGQNRAECFGNVTNRSKRDYLIWESMDNWLETETNLFTVTANIDNVFNFADVTYAGSYRQFQEDSLDNWSRLDMADMVKTWIINYDKISRVTHEFRIQDNGQQDSVKWTVGAFYDKNWRGAIPNSQYQYHQKDAASIAVFSDWNDWVDWEDYWGELGIFNVGQLGQALYGDSSKNYNFYYDGQYAREFALFGEVSYIIKTDNIGRFELTGGIRYFDLEDYASYGYSGIWEAREGRAVLSQGEESGNRKKVSIAWLPDSSNMSIYALYSEGYRPGGNNAPLANACRNDEFAGAFQERYKSDSIDNYEIGYKANTGRLQFSTAIYQINWSDVWASVYMPSCGFSYTANAAKARSRGLEWESKYSFDHDLDLVFNASYTNSKMLSDVPSLQAKAGQDMTQVPKYNAYLGLDKGLSLFDKQTYLRLDIEAYGEYKSHFNARLDGSDTSPSYQRVNLSSRMELNDNIRLSFYINNVFDKQIDLYRQARTRSGSTNNLNVLFAPERSFTLRVDYTFL
ncbi:TonB-dependent receptor [Alishewanella jeotgali]|uniref:TonB-dependent receptor n=1 Tax=Alishewanella jeotgali KCTC 22429 TaxID=1129374 RepID=H3ZHH4_9ALTE|nr:TonB-dependent receptor [Alishewanella jeotgali]EHR39830.1 TonB-dependent receptor [Alishewanella jeotgali KCTC 22429]